MCSRPSKWFLVNSTRQTFISGVPKQFKGYTSVSWRMDRYQMHVVQFHFMIGQNGIGKNTLWLYRSYHYQIQDCCLIFYVAHRSDHDYMNTTTPKHNQEQPRGLKISKTCMSHQSRTIFESSLNIAELAQKNQAGWDL